MAQLDVVQPDVVQGLELSFDVGNVLEEFQCLFNGHVQNIRDAAPLVLDFQRLTVVPLAFAYLAGHVDVRQKVHLDLDQAVPLARLTPAPFHVEAVAPQLVPPNA